MAGTLVGEVSRPGKPSIKFEKNVELLRGQTKEIAFAPAEYKQLAVANPDLWWPYQWGEAKLYRLKLEFRVGERDRISDSQTIDFGIRKITQGRDADNSFPEIGEGGNFYLKVNGKDYLIRGGVYSPDLLFRNDPARDATIMRYAKDLGLNLLRWELKIADDTMIDRADHEGMPVMLGFMCCAQALMRRSKPLSPASPRRPGYSWSAPTPFSMEKVGCSPNFRYAMRFLRFTNISNSPRRVV